VEQLGAAGARTALLVPMLHHGVGIGVLAAFDHGEAGGEFTAGDEQLLRTFAASAANAVALNRSVEAGRLRSAIAAADTERGRWARDLHDQTLQSLGGLRVLLSSAVRRGDAGASQEAMRQAIEDIETEIENLRAIISDLRPSLLDDLGLGPAIEALVERRRGDGLTIDTELALPASGAADDGFPPELETAIYRLVQESLTNVVKHARARAVRVLVDGEGDAVVVEVRDDGVGFDTSAQTEGFGLAGVRERVFLAGGSLHLESGDQGTLVRAELPIERSAGSADQMAS
jgi:signal transduction histidine kinase